LPVARVKEEVPLAGKGSPPKGPPQPLRVISAKRPTQVPKMAKMGGIKPVPPAEEPAVVESPRPAATAPEVPRVEKESPRKGMLQLLRGILAERPAPVPTKAKGEGTKPVPPAEEPAVVEPVRLAATAPEVPRVQEESPKGRAPQPLRVVSAERPAPVPTKAEGGGTKPVPPGEEPAVVEPVRPAATAPEVPRVQEESPKGRAPQPLRVVSAERPAPVPAMPKGGGPKTIPPTEKPTEKPAEKAVGKPAEQPEKAEPSLPVARVKEEVPLAGKESPQKGLPQPLRVISAKRPTPAKPGGQKGLWAIFFRWGNPLGRRK
jgi:hypothetical protein